MSNRLGSTTFAQTSDIKPRSKMMKKASENVTELGGSGPMQLDIGSVISALNHPLRRQILQAWGDEETSPRDMADRLGCPLSNVSYHVRVLVDHGVLELVRTEPVRGSMQHFYASIAGRDEQLRRFLFGAPSYDGHSQPAP